MKRLLCLLLSLLLILSLAACGSGTEEPEDPVNFYYLRRQDPGSLHHGSGDSVILAEVREAQGLREDLELLLNQYLKGPETTDTRSPFPRNTRLVQWSVSDRVLYLTLTAEFAALKNLDLTLACACLTRTCLELAEVDGVHITAEDPETETTVSVQMDRDNLIFTDNSELKE